MVYGTQITIVTGANLNQLTLLGGLTLYELSFPSTFWGKFWATRFFQIAMSPCMSLVPAIERMTWHHGTSIYIYVMVKPYGKNKHSQMFPVEI